MINLWPDVLALPHRTLTGAGVAPRLLPECAAWGRRGLLAHGRSLRQNGLLARILEDTPPGVVVTPWEHAGGEPTLDHLAGLLRTARRQEADWIAGVGGGSVLDLAKAAAGLFHAARSPEEYHDGAPVEAPGLPFAAVPTTAGTGSEATINTVLTHAATGQKKSIRDDRFMARLVILDPDLLASCPLAVIAQSGMDALTQAVEAFTSRQANWLSDTCALQGMTLIAAFLECVYRGGRGEPAQALQQGSYLAGLGLSLARLGVVHGVAHPLGARYRQPHGLVCAVCLPHALALNREAMGEKYRQMSEAMGGDALERVRALNATFGLCSPWRGQRIGDRAAIVRETLASGSTRANPKPIAEADVEWLLDRLEE